MTLAPNSTEMAPAYHSPSHLLVQRFLNQVSIQPHSLQTFLIDTRLWKIYEMNYES